jgi:4-alpha-glucanotransferase
MNVTIRLRYHTRFGQKLFLCSQHEWFGGVRQEPAPLRYVNDEFWELALDLPDIGFPEAPVSYYFLLHNPDGSVTEDFGGDRKLCLADLALQHTVIIDSWNDLGTVENVFSTEPFQRVLLRTERPSDGAKPPENATHWFNIKAPLLPSEQTICLLGSAHILGGWNSASPVLLQRNPESGCFSVGLDLAGEPWPIAYKYGVYDLATKAFVRYEDGSNRVLAEAAPQCGRVIAARASLCQFSVCVANGVLA